MVWVKGNASQSAPAPPGQRRLLVIEGDAAARCGIFDEGVSTLPSAATSGT